MDTNENVINVDKLMSLIQNKDIVNLRSLFENTPIIDIAEAADKIEDPIDLLFIFKVVKSEYSAELFTYLDSDSQESLIRLFSNEQLIDLMSNSYTDDIADFLEEMPANLVSKILAVANPDTRAKINRLLNYKENTAGTVMTTEYIEVLNSLNVGEALNQIREKGKKAETVFTIFVRDAKRNLVGTVGLDDLVFATPNTPLNDVMNIDFQTCSVDDDQEEVAQLFKRYDLNAIAVLNEDKRLTGIITIDDIIDVIEEETSEDMAKLAGVRPLENSYIKTGVFRMALKCTPWLIVLMVLAVFSSLILSKFEGQLASIIVLTVFIPMIMDTGGNAGGQTTTLIVRSLALNEFTTRDYFKIVLKEFLVALITGAFVCVFVFFWVIFEMYVGIVSFSGISGGLVGWDLFAARSSVACIVALTLFCTIIISKFIGVSLPMLAKVFKRDPALMSGPFVTTIVDVCSLLIYFGFAMMFFPQMA